MQQLRSREVRQLDQDQPARLGQNQGLNLGVSDSLVVTDCIVLPLQGRTRGSTSETQERFLEEVLIAKMGR